MLLRLHVKGFKNLRDTTVRLGPLTCFVGANAVGKSNIFDAIQFLRGLADHDIQTAAQSIRRAQSGSFGPRDLLWNGDKDTEIGFEVDMAVPPEVTDDFGRTTRPAATLLRYEVAFRYTESPAPRLELAKEQLRPLKIGDAPHVLGFSHSKAFRKGVAIKPTRRGGPFISTRSEANDGITVMLHQDGGSRGRPIPAGASPRTVVGGTNAADYPTVLAARREMASWRILHLEPSAMRAPDPFGGPNIISESGAHLAETLHRLSAHGQQPAQVLSEAANRLAELVPDVRELRLDDDLSRQQRSIQVKMRHSDQWLGPRALSDGTLRFLALVTMLLDTQSTGSLCMEEPENGMHPGRVPAMIDILREFAVDPEEPVDSDNPLRQVILNTHSPDVTRQLDVEHLLFVDGVDTRDGREAVVSAVEGTWRAKDMPFVPRQKVADFIGGSPPTREMEQLTLKFGTAQP